MARSPSLSIKPSCQPMSTSASRSPSSDLRRRSTQQSRTVALRSFGNSTVNKKARVSTTSKGFSSGYDLSFWPVVGSIFAATSLSTLTRCDAKKDSDNEGEPASEVGPVEIAPEDDVGDEIVTAATLTIFMDGPSIQTLADTWWLYAIQGVGLLGCGALTLANPEIALLSMLTVFGVGNAIYGTMRLAHAGMTFKQNKYWWIEVLDAIVSFALTAAVVVYPGMTTVTLLYFYAAFLLIGGALQTGIGLIYNELPTSLRVGLGLSGLASLGVGGWMLYVRPELGVYGALILLGYKYVFRGVASLGNAIQLKALQKDVNKLKEA